MIRMRKKKWNTTSPTELQWNLASQDLGNPPLNKILFTVTNYKYPWYVWTHRCLIDNHNTFTCPNSRLSRVYSIQWRLATSLWDSTAGAMKIHKTLFCNTKSDCDLACGYIHVHCICYSIAILVFSPRCTNLKACQSYNLQAFSKDYRHGEEFKNFNVQGHLV